MLTNYLNTEAYFVDFNAGAYFLYKGDLYCKTDLLKSGIKKCNAININKGCFDFIDDYELVFGVRSSDINITLGKPF